MKINKTKLIKKIVSGATSIALLSASIIPVSITLATPAHAAAALSITAEVDKNQADRGDILNYTAVVKNTGNQDTANTIIWTAPLNKATWVAGSYTRSATGVTKPLANNFTTAGGNFGVIPAGQNITFNIQTKVADNANPGDTMWLVIGAKADGVPTVEAKAYTNMFFREANLCAKKTADKEVYSPGETVHYTIELCNGGNVLLENVRMFDEIPDEVTYVKGTAKYSTTGGFATDVTDAWVVDGVNLGHLEVDEKGFFKFDVKIKDNVKDGTVIHNGAKVNSDQTNVWLDCGVDIRVVAEDEVGHLKIFKFEDTDGNAVYDEGERSLPGFKFTIKGEGFEKTVTTAGDGVVVVRNLKPGTYTITESVPAGWRITTDNNIKVTVKADDLTEVRFGNKQVGKVLGKVKKLPDTGPGVILALLGASIPAGLYIKRLKTKI